ncbi:MAG: hypothetical protein JXA92_00965 [candidate division Zixibacteria bacterium]|nr:hypothetical protein [candidate division Zixibacteria bacterium]
MLAKVIDVTEDTVYLEIDKQLRFKSQYVIQSNREQMAISDNVNFSFSNSGGGSLVIINDIISELNSSF